MMISDHETDRKINGFGRPDSCCIICGLSDGDRTMMEQFGGVPARLGAGALAEMGAAARTLAPQGGALAVLDPAVAARGLADPALAALDAAGVAVTVFSDFAGEPKAADIDAAAAAARAAGARIVLGIGGGSALDIAKMAAFCAVSGAPAEAYAECASPVPAPLPRILAPTTAGAGAEMSATCVFAAADGRKTWAWDAAAKPDLVILDPVPGAALPPGPTAWCGMDAFVHAFEAATNRKADAASRAAGREALALIAEALPRAVAAPGDLAARMAMLRAAALAGVAIDAAGTAIAHMASHALASLAPVHHGLATALAFEASLGWLVEAPTPDLDAAAQRAGARRRGGASAPCLRPDGPMRHRPPPARRLRRHIAGGASGRDGRARQRPDAAGDRARGRRRRARRAGVGAPVACAFRRAGGSAPPPDQRAAKRDRADIQRRRGGNRHGRHRPRRQVVARIDEGAAAARRNVDAVRSRGNAGVQSR
jgi:alcohol dehydrogenase class IV